MCLPSEPRRGIEQGQRVRLRSEGGVETGLGQKVHLQSGLDDEANLRRCLGGNSVQEVDQEADEDPKNAPEHVALTEADHSQGTGTAGSDLVPVLEQQGMEGTRGVDVGGAIPEPNQVPDLHLRMKVARIGHAPDVTLCGVPEVSLDRVTTSSSSPRPVLDQAVPRGLAIALLVAKLAPQGLRSNTPSQQ